jgi:hypothetical protein
MVWTLENPPKYNKSHSLAKGMNYLMGKHFPGVQTNAEHFFSLYYYLLDNLNTPVAKLRAQITQNGEPIFSIKELKQILEILSTQKNTRLAKYKIVKGGAAPTPAAPAPTPAAPTPAAPASPVEDDPSRTKFWDKMIRKITYPIASRIPPSWDGVFWYLHFLYHMEKMDLVGPMISTSLDTVTLSLPVLADMAEEFASKAISLAPVPYASFLGDGLGYAISLIFISFAVVLNFSRKHFGSAFKVALEAVPVFGDTLAETSQGIETGAERYLNNREKMLKSIDKVSPAAEDILDYYSPDVEIHNEPPPPISLNVIKQNVVDYVAEETGIDKALDAVQDPTKALSAAASQAGMNKALNAVQDPSKAISAAVNAAAKKGMNKAANAVQEQAKSVVNAAAKTGKVKAKGGKRSTRKSKNVLLSSRK